MKGLEFFLIAILSLFQFQAVNADEIVSATDNVRHLQTQWAKINYQMQGEAQVLAFESLVEKANKLSAEQPKSAEVLIWAGIIKSTFAGVESGLGALKLAKLAKADLDRAIEIDGTAMNGSAYTSLGTLYYNVPGWPLGFGDNKEAEKLFKKALRINPDGIDSNYFYGDFLYGKKHYQKAKMHMEKAQKAAPRPGREVADRGRQQEIEMALSKINKKLN